MSVPVLRTIELETLQIFKAVVDFGGVTRAAAQLHRVPSNVTTRLKQLEEGLGTKLFHRQSRKLLLSNEGKLLLAYAERLLRLSSEAEFAVRSGKPRGKLRIGTLESTAASRLPPVLARYHRANPETQIELVTGTTCALLEQVSRYSFLSGRQNIDLLLSTPYVANWPMEASAKTSRRFVRSGQRLRPGEGACLWIT